MLQLDIKTAKNFFFYDQAGRQRIFAGVDKARHKALTRAGAMVRTVARRSLRKARRKTLAELTSDQRTIFEIRKRIAKSEGKEAPKRPFAPSLPGEPPRMRLGLLKRFLYFAYDSETQSVVVGPAKLTNFPGPRVHQPGILAGLHLDLNTSLKRKTAAGADTVHLYPSGVHVSNVTIANFPRGLSNYQTYGATVLNSVTGWTYNDIRVWSAREGNGYASSNATWAIQVPAGCIARDLSIFTQFSTSNGNYIPLQIYGINSTGAIADCRGGFVDGATIIHVTSQGAIVCAAGAVGNLSRHNIVTRNIRTSFVTPTYFVQDATNSSLEAMTNIGVTVLPSLTSEDPHQYYGLAENSGQY